MAEYDYSVEHIPGVDNHVPDQLSRLIERPDSDWTPLECDDDTDVTYPFLMCHPAVHRCLKQAIAHGPILNTEADRAWAPIEHKLNCAVGYANVNVSDASGLHFDELKNQYVHARQHQKHLGGQGHQKHLKYAAPSYRSPAAILKFSKDDYLQCPEFRVVYGMLLKIKEHQAKLLAVLRNKKSTTSTEIRSTDKKYFLMMSYREILMSPTLIFFRIWLRRKCSMTVLKLVPVKIRRKAVLLIPTRVLIPVLKIPV